uniref:Uncharacterized protein n=1 Tax=Cairina moschata TaxID=8855 RepID=A0A8C3C3L0_CAIMO
MGKTVLRKDAKKINLTSHKPLESRCQYPVLPMPCFTVPHLKEYFNTKWEKEENLCCPYPSLAAGWEQMEETFVASSTGEGMELINMVQQEDYQRLRNSAVKDLLLNQCEIIVVVTDDGNVNIYLCFKITY